VLISVAAVDEGVKLRLWVSWWHQKERHWSISAHCNCAVIVSGCNVQLQRICNSVTLTSTSLVL